MRQLQDDLGQPQPQPGTCHYRTAANGETLPDPNCTPGAISPKVNRGHVTNVIAVLTRRRIPLFCR
jgi:hypothetical protein